MADNLAWTPGSGATIRTQDKGGAHVQAVQVDVGDDSTVTPLVLGQAASAASVPVVIASDQGALTVASHAVTNAGTFAVQITGDALTALQLIDNINAAIAGSEMQVDVVGPLPAGTNAIGKLAANSGVDIGDVDILSIAAGDNNIGNVDVVTLPATPAGTNLIGRIKPEGDEYETVAASQTAQVLGATGGTGDYIAGVLVVPATTSPGNVLLLDNATSITIFAGGASSVSNLVPFFIPLGMTSVSGAWKITTGSNVSCIGIGNFT
jgi:hypothetical protein